MDRLYNETNNCQEDTTKSRTHVVRKILAICPHPHFEWVLQTTQFYILATGTLLRVCSRSPEVSTYHSMARANLNKSKKVLTFATKASKYISKRPRISINWNPPFQTQIYLVKLPLNVNIVKQDLLHKQDRRYSDPKARNG